MPGIGTPVAVGSVLIVNTGQTAVIPVGVAVAAGDHVIVGAGSTASGVPTGITDTQGNTYVIDKSDVTLRGVGIGSAKITNPLSTSDTITVTYNASANGKRGAGAISVSGLDATTWLDAVNAASGTTNAWQAATGTLAQADEIVVAFGIHVANSTSTPVTNYTELYDFGDAASNFSMVYRIVSATTTHTAGGTWSSSGSQSDMVLATYKQAAAGGTDVNVNAPAGAVTLGAVAPQVQGTAQVTAPPGLMTLAAVAPAVSGAATVQAPAAVMTLGAVDPTMSGVTFDEVLGRHRTLVGTGL